jgi:phosphate acyltransferase
MRPALRGFRDGIDPERSGGAFMLGLRRVGIVAHGRFSRRGFANAIAVAEKGVRERVVERTHEDLEAAGVLRRPPERRPSESAASVGVQ